ncbi:uncharacterized protein [Linepithema humile]|uniref:uncharacterized protein n=1 Tax=Linepithema humile TaxID=83485 RepID=UPI0006239260|nr:PREDICTED: LOW QUALITY PROTEIN: uncharacterized protein LOC105680004 [Linepithema humile]
MTEDRRTSIYRKRINCTCGWEVKFGYGVAFTLAVFEAKRLFVLALEIFAEWQVIRLAGGLQPVALILAEVALGLPCALMTVRTIRRRKLTSFPNTKQVLKCLLMMIVVCAAVNTATLASIGYHISVRRETLVHVFNASMQLYVKAASYKYAIDEIQFVLQCCGHTSYTDWFLFDWQRVDYASREEMAEQSKISDEDYRDRGVPFSCCNLRAVAPCVHIEMTDDKTINVNGCAEVISPILFRIVIVAYIMTSTLIIIQVLLAYLIARMVNRFMPQETPYLQISLRDQNPNTCCHPLLIKSHIKKNKKDKPPLSKYSCSIMNHENCTWDVAKIKPSVHEEHKISTKRFYKHAR